MIGKKDNINVMIRAGPAWHMPVRVPDQGFLAVIVPGFL